MSIITNLFRKKHKHSWALRYNLQTGHQARQCQDPKCGVYESKMWDFSSHTWSWLPGNFIADVGRPIYIIAGNYDEFLVAKQILTTGSNAIGHSNIKFVAGYEDFNRYDSMPDILFWGTWYTNGILEDPRITSYLNRRR